MNRILLTFLLAGSLSAQIVEPICDFDGNGVPVCLEPQADPIDGSLLESLSLALPETQNVNVHHPEFLDNAQVNLVLTDSAEVWVTFVNEGAGYKNSFGYYIFDPSDPPASALDVDPRTLIFPNASRLGSGGGLAPGDRMHLGVFPPGTGIGWFLIADAWRNGGVDVNRATWFGEHLLNPAEVPMAIQLHDEDSDRIFVCFEDIRADTGGDRDYNDLICSATVTPPEAVDWDDVIVLPDDDTAGLEPGQRPVSCRIQSVYPNPFNPSTTIVWNLEETGLASLRVHDLTGRVVAVLHEGLTASGPQYTVFDAAALPSGVYFCALEAQGRIETTKLVLLK